MKTVEGFFVAFFENKFGQNAVALPNVVVRGKYFWAQKALLLPNVVVRGYKTPDFSRCMGTIVCKQSENNFENDLPKRCFFHVG